MNTLFMSLDTSEPITVDGQTFFRHDHTTVDGYWIVGCDRCGEVGTIGWNNNTCPECDGNGVTLQEPIAPIKPCQIEDHEFEIHFAGYDGIMLTCLDKHSNLVKRAMEEWVRINQGDGYFHQPGCELPGGSDDLAFNFKAKLVYRTCGNPGGWHGLERCDCGYLVDVAEITELGECSV